MGDVTRRKLVTTGATIAGLTTVGLAAGRASAQTGFMAASAGPGGPQHRQNTGPGLQGITALCEVTGGGEKVYGVAVEYDVAIDPASIDLATYAIGVVPAARGFRARTPQTTDKNASTEAPQPRAVAAIYTSASRLPRAGRQHHLPNLRRRRPHGFGAQVLLHRRRQRVAVQAG